MEGRRFLVAPEKLDRHKKVRFLSEEMLTDEEFWLKYNPEKLKERQNDDEKATRSL